MSGATLLTLIVTALGGVNDLVNIYKAMHAEGRTTLTDEEHAKVRAHLQAVAPQNWLSEENVLESTSGA